MILSTVGDILTLSGPVLPDGADEGDEGPGLGGGEERRVQFHTKCRTACGPHTCPQYLRPLSCKLYSVCPMTLARKRDSCRSSDYVEDPANPKAVTSRVEKSFACESLYHGYDFDCPPSKATQYATSGPFLIENLKHP